MSMVNNSIGKLIYPSKEISKDSHFKTLEEYKCLYDKSIENPQQFWSEVCEEFYWKSPPKTVLQGNFDVRKGPISVKFMEGAVTNVCYNLLDRHIEKGWGDRIAYHWEGNDGKSKRRITYTELRREVCKFANGLKGLDIKKGDRIAIYMPVSIECVVAMLACARIGAVHCVVFAGFAPESLADRILDARCVLLVSADGCYRGSKLIPLKNMADSALDICEQRGFQKISNIVYKHLNISSKETDDNNNNIFVWNEQVDIWWHKLIENEPDYCEPTWIDAEHPLFILYTSGSSGKPKGLIHSSAGYLINSYLALKYCYDYREGDVCLSTADLGWNAAHCMSVYGGLANPITNVLLEGMPTYPTIDRVWEIIDRLEVNVFFTPPAVIRNLMNSGDHYVKAYKRSSLRVLAIAGEPINKEAWLWYWNVVGDQRCSVVNIYAQTETAVPVISPLPGCTPMKPGSSTLPFFGIELAVLDDNGQELVGPAHGHLVIKKPWPSIARTFNGKHSLYEETYFHKFPGYFWTADLVRRDADGYYWVEGRVDDTIKVSGHLLSLVEIESAIVENMAVAQVSVVSAPHKMKGEVPFVFVVLNDGYKMSTQLKKDLVDTVRQRIGALAQPERIIAVKGLPMNMSGKVLRRILHNIVRKEADLGDTSTLANTSILEELHNISIDH